jgi:hypothetical protein
MWCNARAGSAHCWEGYVVTPPPAITDGTGAASQSIISTDYKGINDKYIDMYAVQDCIRKIDGSKWLADDNV